MFTVKASYRQETRKIKFSDSPFFPSYNQLNQQLYRVFPISHNYVLSKLLFSPDSNKPSVRILVANEVKNAEEYQRAIGHLQGRAFPGSLLRFSIFDETVHKVPTSSHSESSQLQRRLNDPWTPSFPGASTANSGVNWDMNMFHSPASAIPPPPIIFSSPSVASPTPFSLPGSPIFRVPPPMEIDGVVDPSMTASHQHSPAQDPENFWNRDSMASAQLSSGAQHLPHQPQHQQQPQSDRTMSRSSSCCSVSQGKAEIHTLLTTFKFDLDRIMSNNFGPLSGNITSPLLNDTSSTVTAVPGAWPERPETSPSWGVRDISNEGPVPSDARPCVNMWCMVCGKLFGGPWYSCDKCSWHVLCTDCVGNHGPEHGRNFGDGHIMNKRTCSGCPREPVLSQAVPPVNPIPAPTPAADRKAPPPLVVHKGVVCNVCESTIVGVRHKCLDCPDYDLCTSCIETGSAERHDPFHEFFEIEEAGRVVVHTVFSGDGERDAAWTPRRTTANPTPTVTPSPRTVSAEPVTHNATCDLCDSNIRGTRYKCVNCIDFDTCASCFSITTEQHPHHGFVAIHNVGDLIMRDGLAVNTRHYATCDGCKKNIYGIRYKCMHPDCPDFDLCAMCESHPIPTHPPKHPMLKMKTVDTVVPTVYRVGMTTLIDKRISAKDNIIRDEEKALPTPPMPSNAEDGRSEAETPTEDHLVKTDPSLASSTAGFTLPPLALDPRNDLFREFWPKVTQEFKQTQDSQADFQIQDISHPISPTLDMAPQASAETISDPFCDPEPKSAVLYSPDLSAQALLSRPVSNPIIREMMQQTMTPVVTHGRSLAALLNGYRSPSPSLTSSLAASINSLDCTDQNETTSAIPSTPTRAAPVPLVASFLSDTTVPDGQIFPPGAEFVKSWRMVNDGSRDWPETTELHYFSGDKFFPEHSASQKVKVGKVVGGSEVDVWTGELKAPEMPGNYRGYWRLSDAEGTYFGHTLWVDITVAETSHQSDGSEGSLASSSIIMMPQAAASAHSNAPSDIQHNQQAFPHSSITAESKLSTDDDASDGGSIGSSVSLISVPSSDDDEDWQDSRSRGATSPPETLRDATEYIVLFDDTSSDEE